MRASLKTLAQDTGMTYDQKRMSAFGYYQGYQMIIRNVPNVRVFEIRFYVNGGTPEQAKAVQDYFAGLSQSNPAVKSAVFDGVGASVQVKSNGKNRMEALKEVLNSVLSVCRSSSMVSCCKYCGAQTNLGVYSLGGECASLCGGCFEKAQSDLSMAKQSLKEQKSNIAGGIVGALLGSLIGVALWVIVYQLGYIAGIVGFVMAVCCMKGYEKFGGKLNAAGMVISLLIAVAMLYFAENVSLALEIYNEFKTEYDITFFDAFRAIPEFMKDDSVSRSVLSDLAMGYLLMLVASVSSIRATYQNANLKHEMKKLS
ncbi:hypothetical protein CAFE_24130 [Caprobacter fermentans]|uniref:Uncharacterized protein n=1 Tax=Caproicibacter fermentans TaxID=2576756 RepID=A0A6N8I1R4_9FIRM|nr:hypothetical protein [Caproicibacter fermentans]MVB11690.1 hypothetical protein [Caproicibacter fermentans]OCN02615.1 hypothetical protein A7X67_18710 [Clostridium sp. W14A]QNK39734.1 hypothetical protein HCR03_13505 [Caproicibacter fermentans]